MPPPSINTAFFSWRAFLLLMFLTAAVFLGTSFLLPVLPSQLATVFEVGTLSSLASSGILATSTCLAGLGLMKVRQIRARRRYLKTAKTQYLSLFGLSLVMAVPLAVAVMGVPAVAGWLAALPLLSVAAGVGATFLPWLLPGMVAAALLVPINLVSYWMIPRGSVPLDAHEQARFDGSQHPVSEGEKQPTSLDLAKASETADDADTHSGQPEVAPGGDNALNDPIRQAEVHCGDVTEADPVPESQESTAQSNDAQPNCLRVTYEQLQALCGALVDDEHKRVFKAVLDRLDPSSDAALKLSGDAQDDIFKMLYHELVEIPSDCDRFAKVSQKLIQTLNASLDASAAGENLDKPFLSTINVSHLQCLIQHNVDQGLNQLNEVGGETLTAFLNAGWQVEAAENKAAEPDASQITAEAKTFFEQALDQASPDTCAAFLQRFQALEGGTIIESCDWILCPVIAVHLISEQQKNPKFDFGNGGNSFHKTLPLHEACRFGNPMIMHALVKNLKSPLPLLITKPASYGILAECIFNALPECKDRPCVDWLPVPMPENCHDPLREIRFLIVKICQLAQSETFNKVVNKKIHALYGNSSHGEALQLEQLTADCEDDQSTCIHTIIKARVLCYNAFFANQEGAPWFERINSLVDDLRLIVDALQPIYDRTNQTQSIIAEMESDRSNCEKVISDNVNAMIAAHSDDEFEAALSTLISMNCKQYALFLRLASMYRTKYDFFTQTFSQEAELGDRVRNVLSRLAVHPHKDGRATFVAKCFRYANKDRGFLELLNDFFRNDTQGDQLLASLDLTNAWCGYQALLANKALRPLTCRYLLLKHQKGDCILNLNRGLTTIGLALMLGKLELLNEMLENSMPNSVLPFLLITLQNPGNGRLPTFFSCFRYLYFESNSFDQIPALAMMNLPIKKPSNQQFDPKLEWQSFDAALSESRLDSLVSRQRFVSDFNKMVSKLDIKSPYGEALSTQSFGSETGKANGSCAAIKILNLLYKVQVECCFHSFGREMNVASRPCALEAVGTASQNSFESNDDSRHESTCMTLAKNVVKQLGGSGDTKGALSNESQSGEEESLLDSENKDFEESESVISEKEMQTNANNDEEGPLIQL